MSMITDPKQVQALQDGGKMLGEILEQISELVVPGISAFEIDQKAEELILKTGGRPAFKGYRQSPRDPKFPSTICASVNDEVVHGIASKDKILEEGDIFSMDIGMQWPPNSGMGTRGNGLFTDTALTVAVGDISEQAKQLMAVTRKALFKGIEQVQVGNSIAAIGKAIENYLKPQGYGIVQDLVGHGVGNSLHEEPRVPNYYDAEMENYIIKPGLTIAIEPMVTIGTHKVVVEDDDWTISTADGKLSAHFEHTIHATENGPIIITKRPGEKI